MAFVLDVNLRIQQVLGLEAAKQQLAGIQVGGIGQVQKLSTGIKSVGVATSTAAIHVAKGANVIIKLGKNIQKTGEQTDKAAKKVKNFGDQIFLAGKRYAAFIASTIAAYKALQLISVGTKSIIEFDQAMVSLAQILDKPLNQVNELSQQFLDLSVSTGTSAAEIAVAAKLLAQAGFRGAELTEAISQLAKVPLTPIFEGMDQAVDGAIAAMRQFNKEGLTVEDVFDKMINVSNKYAASFPDIIEGLKRGGSAFQAIGGRLDEFIAAFTTIRSVTRESASAVGTSLKTISSRLADPKIIKFLETKNIRLIEEGQFVGPLDAMRRIGEGLKRAETIQEKINIAVRLGGRRQISRFIALADNMEKNNEILEVSKNSMNAFSRVAEQGLQAIGKQIDVLINKAKKLAIDLGEDLFIPFIKGLTGAAEATITLLDVLKPILPLIAKIGTAFAGIAVAKTIGGFVGSRLGQLAGPAAFTAAGGGLRGAGAGLRASPFVQAGLLIAAAEVTASFAKTTEGADTFASTLITSTAMIAAAMALFKQQTITQFAMGGGLFPTLGKTGKLGAIGGTLATVGAIAVPLAIIKAQKSAKELSDKIVNSAVKSIEDIRIEPIDPKSLEKGLSDLYQTIGQSVQELIKSADVRDDPSLQKTFQGIGRAIGNIFEGDYETLMRRGGLTQKNVEEHVQRILQKSPKLVDNLIQSIANSMVVEGEIGGKPFVERKKLVEAGLERGLDFRQANLFANAITDSVGGLKIWTARIQKSAELLQKEAEKREKVIQLTKIFIPPKLIGQLLQFSKAVDKTARAISISARLFETQIAEIEGGIQVPTFELDFGAKQIEQLIRGGDLKELFAFTPDIPKFVGGLSEIEDLLDQFIINISNLPTDINLTEEVNKFFEFQQDVPKVVRDNFESFFHTIAEDIRLASEGQLIDVEEIKGRFKKEFSDLGLSAADATVEIISKFLNSTFAQIQDELNRLATVRRFELAAPVRPETQAAFLEQQLKRVGMGVGVGRGPANILRGTFEELELIQREMAARGGAWAERGYLPTPRPEFFQGRGQKLADIAGDERIRQRVRNSFQKVVIESSNLRKKLAELQPGSEGFIIAANRAKELARTTIELQTTLEAFDQATKQALESEMQTLKLRQQFELRQARVGIEERDIEPIRAQREIFDLQQKHLQEQAALQDKFDIIIEKDNMLRVNLAKEISESTKTQADVVQDFDTSVNIFSDATRVQVTTIDLMKQYITDFGQAVVDFNNLNVTAQPMGGENGTNITPTQIKTGSVTIQQAYDEYNRLLNEGNANQKNMVNILQSIYDRQEQIQPTKQEPSIMQKEQERNTETNEKMGQLTESLDNLHTILSEPNELKLITDQHIDIDLSTLPLDISAEIRPILEEAVIVAAKTVTRKALESLAAKSESEISIAATDTAQELT